MESYVLENEKLSVEIVPVQGGKTISIYGKMKKFELLAQKSPHRAYGSSGAFADAAFGFDDAFPCIDAGEVSVGGRKICYPDHGEIWSKPMQVQRQGNGFLSLSYESPVLQYHYEKDIALRDASVVYAYRIKNCGAHAFPCIWAFHCLVRYEEDMQIRFPKGTDAFVNVLSSAALGQKETVYEVEQVEGGLLSAQTGYRFDRVPVRKSRSVEKYYVKDSVKEGICGYDFPSQDVTCTISYDHEKLPYLGFYVTAGGLWGDYNCALEPCDGYYDSVESAAKNGRCGVLAPGESKEFEIEIKLEQRAWSKRAHEAKGGTYGNQNFRR